MRVQESLKDSPSLKPYLDEVLADCYTQAKKMAEIETDLDCFPVECPYAIQEVLDQDFLPG